MKKHTISFAGAGRLAGILCTELFRRGHRIDLIVSPTQKHGPALAHSCNTEWSTELTFPSTTELIIVSVPDSKIEEVLSEIRCDKNTVVVHTSGSTGIDVFPSKTQKFGVFYPLQTFSPGRTPSFTELPVFIEASSGEVSDMLNETALSLGAKPCYCETEKRRILHMAAVFANNFSNHMLTLADDIAGKAGYSFSELKPLVTETFAKALENGPASSQTGPAVRNDKNTIRKHMELLSFDHDLEKIYDNVSGSIIKYHNK